MHEHHDLSDIPSHEPNDSVRAGYEVSDMNVNVIVGFGLTLAAIAISCFITVVFAIKYMDKHVSALNNAAASPLAHPGFKASDQPRLQSNPVADKRAIIKEAKDHLAGYGMSSDQPGIERAYIPVESAIDVVAAGKTAYRQAPTTATLQPDVKDTPANAANGTPNAHPDTPTAQPTSNLAPNQANPPVTPNRGANQIPTPPPNAGSSVKPGMPTDAHPQQQEPAAVK